MLVVAANELRHLQRQIAGERVQALKRGELRQKAKYCQLKDLFWTRQVPQPMLPRIEERRLDERRRRRASVAA